VLGALAAQTERVELVTRPTIRYHPAVVAQKAATVAVMSAGRFRLASAQART
jgi:alkanesulfonate monooxygenase SsuD/methylene tetrahydromethanopterin reductase-like flavin-dependent oxidoreductase (luciferase family)